MKYKHPTVPPRTIKSKNSAPGNAFKKEPLKYTGTALLGIATMHKSNAVPVFSSDSAREISQMNE